MAILLSIQAKTRDMFTMVAYDNSNIFSEEVLLDYDGYVPESSLGSGDYLDFVIDNDTGRILNWKPIDLEKLNNG